jgi:hypothetical protein
MNACTELTPACIRYRLAHTVRIRDGLCIGRCAMNACTEPTKDENPLAGGFPSATTKKHNADVTPNYADAKAFATLQARFAIAGHTLYRTVNPDGTILYLAGKWGYFRELKNLEAVAAFLALIGGVQ